MDVIPLPTTPHLVLLQVDAQSCSVDALPRVAMLTRDGMASALKALGVSIAPWLLGDITLQDCVNFSKLQLQMQLPVKN